MTTRRRSLVQGLIVAGAVANGYSGGHAALAQSEQATPATPATPDALTSDALVQRLRETPITSPIFPRDAGDLTILDWVDDNDSDLADTVGAFLVQGPATGDDDQPMIGAYMVHPTVEAAETRFRQQLTDGQDELRAAVFDYIAGWGHYPDGMALVGVVSGPVIVSAAAMGPKRGSDEPAVTDFREADARALANLAGMLDHLRMVMDSGNPA